MAVVVVDASAIMAFLLSEAMPADAPWLSLLAQGALAPAHFPAEVVNGLLVAMRRGRINDAERSQAIAELTNQSIEIDDVPDWPVLDRISTLAENHKLTVYDALYIDLALRRGLPLATCDQAMSSAASLIGIQLVF